MLKVSTVLLSQHLNKTGRPTLDFDNHKSEELWYLLQVHAQETTFGVKKFFYCRLKLMAQRHIEQKIKDSHVKEDSPATSAPSKGKAKGKGKEHAKSNSDRADCIRRIIKQANVRWEMHVLSSMIRTRKAKGKDDLVHLLGQVHHTEIRMVME